MLYENILEFTRIYYYIEYSGFVLQMYKQDGRDFVFGSLLSMDCLEASEENI